MSGSEKGFLDRRVLRPLALEQAMGYTDQNMIAIQLLP